MRTKIIAEIGQAHEGSLGQAHAYIEALSQTGVDVVKFQTHMAQYESSVQEPWRIKFSYEDNTRFDYWKRMEFTEEQWKELKKHTEELGMQFMSTPFSVEAAQMLNRIGVAEWKVSSGEVTNWLLLDYLSSTKKPITISTGMSTWNEIDECVEYLLSREVELSIMQTTSKYPTSNEEVGLNIIDEMKVRYDLPIGLSSHTGNIYAMLAAVARGAELIETHVCMSKHDFGPDTTSAISIDECKQLVSAVRSIESMQESFVDKDAMATELYDTSKIFAKSIYAATDITPGNIIEKELLTCRKPGNGILIRDLKLILGKKAKKMIAKGQMIDWNDIEL